MGGAVSVSGRGGDSPPAAAAPKESSTAHTGPTGGTVSLTLAGSGVGRALSQHSKEGSGGVCGPVRGERSSPASDLEASTAHTLPAGRSTSLTLDSDGFNSAQPPPLEQHGPAVPPELSEGVGSKLLCLIRHGQGKHNPRRNPLALEYVVNMLKADAPLTSKGRRQARALQGMMQSLPFELVVVSPLTRTIETATEIFGDSLTPKWLCHLMCERRTMPSDDGTPASELAAKFPHVSEWGGLVHMPEEFWPKRASRKQAEDEVVERVELFKQWLLARPEYCMALVGHSAFFRTMTGQPKLGNCEAYWCELRPSGEVVGCTPLPANPEGPSDSEYESSS